MRLQKLVRMLGLMLLAVTPVMAQQITVAAAADLNFALPELAANFERASGVKVVPSVGSSGNLYAQIRSGAPYDVFLSADEEYPQKLAKDGLLEAGSVRVYAIGHLVLWVAKGSGLDPSREGMTLLTNAAVTRVALANPQHAPYGRAAMAALEHYGLKERIAAKLVFGENVSQAAQFVQSGNAQAGLIPLSVAKSPAMAEGKFWEVPEDAYPALRQAGGVVAASKQKKAAEAFLEYVVSKEGAQVLQKYGLTPVARP